MIRVILSSLLLIYYTGNAQEFFPTKTYVKNLFRNPLDIPISLVGNFGECRPNHFHSGIDIRTDRKENLPVHAIADGFVSRVKIEAGGFGNALYITHANGVTSLYAHLNKFYPELENHIRHKQYQTKSWNQDVYFLPHQFPVRKGKFIAYSGNTGSSQGPHLHLEIRDSKTEAPLNPLLFFTELQDNKPPKIKQLAVYDGNKSIYHQKPTLLSVSNQKLAKDTITLNSNKAYFGIVGDDFMEIATGTLGIYEMRMYVDDKPYFAWQMDDISYDITRYMNAIADYKIKKNGGPWIQLCRQLPNDQLKVYKSFNTANGLVSLTDPGPKKIRIETYDTKYNKSKLEFYLKLSASGITSSCVQTFTAGKENRCKQSDIDFLLPSEALYDHCCLQTSISSSVKVYSHRYQVMSGDIPVHTYFDLKLKPKTAIPIELKDKVAVVRQPYGKETNKRGKAAILQNGWAVAKVREFGAYEIVIDQKPPLVSTLVKNGMVVKDKMTFVVKEETTTVSSCEAYLDGQWIRLVQKGDAYTYETDEYCTPGNHVLVVKAKDENNNQTEIKFNITR